MKQIEMFSIWANKMEPRLDSDQTCEVWFVDETESVSMSYAALKPIIDGLEVELAMKEGELFTYKVIQPNENR